MIRQDERGAIRELELLRCYGSARWQKSLTDAIFSSSPLPAPPNPQVFADAFSMQFEAMSYSDGQPAGQFEPARILAASASTPSVGPYQGAENMNGVVDQSSTPKQLYLNITADKIEWSTTPPPRSR
jgi:hypothetical protein